MRRPTRHAAKSRRGIPRLKQRTSIVSRMRHANRILAGLWGRVVAVVLFMILWFVERNECTGCTICTKLELKHRGADNLLTLELVDIDVESRTLAA